MGAASASASPSPAPSVPGGADTLSPRLQAIEGLSLSADGGVVARQLAEAAPSLSTAPEGAGSLQVDGQGQLAVSITFDSGPSADDLAAIAAVGRVQASSTLFHRVSAFVAPAGLDTVRSLPGVVSVVEALAPATSGLSGSAAPTAATDAAPAVDVATQATGSATASCRTVPANLAEPLRADLAAADYDVDGTGVTIGVISDSFATDPSALTTPEEDVEAGLLPGPGNPCGDTTPVDVVVESELPATDEGRAMAQLVHGIAPGAKLLFASSGTDELTFHDSILALAEAGATVIVDDITVFSDPFYQDGPVGYAVRQVTEAGIPYLAAAGNFTTLGAEGHPSAGYPITSWEADAYRPAECPAAVLAELEHPESSDCMDFDPGSGTDPTDTLTFEAGKQVIFDLQWAEPVGAAAATFRFALTTPDGVVEVSPANAATLPVLVGATGIAESGDYDFTIVRDTSAGPASDVTPRVKLLLAADDLILAAEYYRSEGGDTVGPTITGHAGASETIAVAAAPYDKPLKPESYTSAGPVTHLFDFQPEVSPIATPLAEPEIIDQPVVMSVDGGFTNFFGEKQSPGVYAFYGTSAAAPAAAAVLALGSQLRPDATVTELRTALTASARAVDVTRPGITASELTGAGLVDAVGYLDEVAALPTPTPTPTPTPVPTTTPVPVPVPADAGSKLANTGAPLDATVGLPLMLGLVLVVGGILAVRTRVRLPRSRSEG